MNFFAWIREQVRRAVLMGVSDAVEHLGSPSPEDEAGQRMLATLRQAPAIEAKPAEAASPRKRLGRSLEQIARPATGPAAAG